MNQKTVIGKNKRPASKDVAERSSRRVFGETGWWYSAQSFQPAGDRQAAAVPHQVDVSTQTQLLVERDLAEP